MKKSRCPMCYEPAVNVCRSCRCTIVRNRRGEADYAYRGTQMVYQRRANSTMDDGSPRATHWLHQPYSYGQPFNLDEVPMTVVGPARPFGRFDFGKGAA